MNILKGSIRLLVLLSFAAAPVFAQESTANQVKDTGNDVKRDVKKGAHRVEEAGCTGTKAECDAKKVENRGDEVKDTVVDKAKEANRKVNPNAK